MYYDVFVSCGNIPEAVLTTIMLAYTKATRNVISMFLALLVLSGPEKKKSAVISCD